MGNQASVEEDIIIKCGLEEMVKHFFEDYMIIWHDPNVESEENKQYIAQLEKFCQVKTFTEWEKASIEIQQAKAHCHVITSGTNGEVLVKEISQSQRVSGVYVFCRNKEYHETWAKSYEKVSCVETRIQNVLDRIKQNLLRWYKEASSLKINLPAFAPIFDDWDKSGMNNLHRYLKVIPNFKNRSQAKKDFLELSKAIYSNEKDTEFIELFEKGYKEYNKKDTLNWYTQESFVYRITNKCLRIATSDSIQYCRLLLRDIEQAIKEQYQEKSKSFSGLLYRGAYLSEEEWSSLKTNLNGEIEMHGFLSVSKDKNVALSFLRDPSKMVFITILVPKSPEESEQGFAEVEEFSRFPSEKEILFNVRSRFTVLETEDKYSEDISCRHLVLLYGAQSFRKFVIEKNPVKEIFIPNNERISCSNCPEEISQNILFTPITNEKVQSYFCKKCLSNFVKVNNAPLLRISQVQPMKQIKLSGILMTYSGKLEVPMYGYECCQCQAKKEKMYYKCAECCCNETKKVWCENCLEEFSECMHQGHCIILESNPFSFWCDKMSQKELDHLKFQNEILEVSNSFQQGETYVESQEYQKAIEYYKIYIERNREKKKDFDLAFAYNNLAYVYDNQADYKRAFEFYSKALEIVKLIYGENHLHVAGCYTCLGGVFESQAEYQKALEYYSKALEIVKSSYGDYSTEVAICYGRMGQINEKNAEYKNALEYHSKALEIYKSLHGDNHPEVATSYNNMGNIYSSQAEYQKALEYHSKALEIVKSSYGSNHPNVATSYSNMGNIYSSQAEYQKALEYHSKALEIRKSFYGDNHPNVATSYNNMGNIYQSQAEYQKALEYHSKALEIRKSFYGDNHPNVATSYSNMGNIYKSQAEYQKALEYHSKALEIDKSFYGDNHPDVAISYSNMGNIYERQAEYQKALEYHSKALKIVKSSYGSNHPNVATSYSNMGNIYSSQAEYQKALESYSKALEIDESFYGDNHPEVATSYNNMGNVFESRAEYQKALEYHSKALEIYRSFYGDNHPNVATSYGHMGNIYESQAEYQKALEYYSKALKIRKLFYSNNHPHLADSLTALGKTYFSLGDQNKALKYYFESLEMKKSVLNDHHPDLAMIYCHIGSTYNKLDEQNKALEYHLRSLEIKKQVFQDNHLNVAESYSGIGRVHFSLGEYNKALEYYFKSLDILKPIFPNQHPDIATSYYDIANVVNSQGKHKEAQEYYSKSLEIRKLFFKDNHPDVVAVSDKIQTVLSKFTDNEISSVQ